MARLGVRTAKDRWVLPGTVMGVAAGMVFTTFQMLAAALAGADFLSPLSTVGGTVLGWIPFGEPYPTEIAALAGLPVYALVFAALGAAFGASSAVGPTRRNRGALLVAGVAFGALLWTLELALVSWGSFHPFPATAQIVQFVAYGVFFGMALALMLGVRMRQEEPVRKRLRADKGAGTPVFAEPRDNRPKGGR